MTTSNLSLEGVRGIFHRPLRPNDDEAIWTPIACGDGIVLPGTQTDAPITCPACLRLEPSEPAA